METRIIVNGREYPSVEAMPPDVRRAYEQSLAHFVDADGNGIPDIVERGDSGRVVGMHQASITFNGRTLQMSGAVPAVLRRLAEAAFGQVHADRGSAPVVDALQVEALPQPTDATGPVSTGAAVASALDRARGDRVSPLDRSANVLERMLGRLLGLVSLVVFALGAVMIANIDASSRSQGGRFYVAVATVVVLGVLNERANWLARRRWKAPGFFGMSDEARRFTLLSTLGLVLAAVLLLGLALLMP